MTDTRRWKQRSSMAGTSASDPQNEGAFVSDAAVQVSGGRDAGAAPVARNEERRLLGPEEIPVNIRYNERDAVTLMCSPGELRELAVGWLFAEGFLQITREIMSIG